MINRYLKTSQVVTHQSYTFHLRLEREANLFMCTLLSYLLQKEIIL